MAIVEYRSKPTIKYYMGKTKSDIIDRIDMMRNSLRLEPIDKIKIKDWSKYSLASEALRTHRMFPPENSDEVSPST